MCDMAYSGTIAHSQRDKSCLHTSRPAGGLRRNAEGHGKTEVLESNGKSRDLDHTTAAKMAGDRNVWCETERELRAVKLNRSEQYKFKTYNTLLTKEMKICEHRYQQKERLMRKKSAQLKSRIKQIEDDYNTDKRFVQLVEPSQERLLNRRRFSDSEATSDGVRNANQRCGMCSQIRNIISVYEKENYPTDESKQAMEHSTCLFSDVHLKSFIRLLEEEHLKGVSNITSRLSINRSASMLFSGSRSSSTIVKHPVAQFVASSAIEKRVKDFCADLVTFNKATNCIPDSVKVALEKTRHEDAVLIRPPPPEPISLRTEVELLFNIRKGTR